MGAASRSTAQRRGLSLGIIVLPMLALSARAWADDPSGRPWLALQWAIACVTCGVLLAARKRARISLAPRGWVAAASGSVFIAATLLDPWLPHERTRLLWRALMPAVGLLLGTMFAAIVSGDQPPRAQPVARWTASAFSGGPRWVRVFDWVAVACGGALFLSLNALPQALRERLYEPLDDAAPLLIALVMLPMAGRFLALRRGAADIGLVVAWGALLTGVATVTAIDLDERSRVTLRRVFVFGCMVVWMVVVRRIRRTPTGS